MDYLDLVEEYNEDKPINQFEKVRVLASRVRDIYEGKPCKVKGLEGRKPTTMAQFEFLVGKIEPSITDHMEEVDEDDFDDIDED